MTYTGADADARLFAEKRKQPGVTFPSARQQEYVLIVRFNLEPSVIANKVRHGLMRLCGLLERIDKGIVKIDELSEDGTIRPSLLSKFNFSATLGFGIGFFEKLKIPAKNRPKKLFEMPNNVGLLDPTPYIMSQTDLIIQLASSKDFVNRWVFQNDVYPITSQEEKKIVRSTKYYNSNSENFFDASASDVVTATRNWAFVTDVHSGFQRIDGKNLLGFNDGVSNPDRIKNDIVWTASEDEQVKFKDSTYMVFQKIEHDLDQWRKLSVEEQEKSIGRSKGTGLLLGTLTKEEDQKLALQLRSENATIRDNALRKLDKLFVEQRYPNKSLFDEADPTFKNIRIECPVWSHVRKANPRGEHGASTKPIFRRGYLFMDESLNGKASSGLLFICFQKDIANGFEYIKKEYLNNKEFPVRAVRRFSKEELAERHRHGRFSSDELKALSAAEKRLLGIDPQAYIGMLEESQNPDSMNTGREGLTGPSQLGIKPRGDTLATVTLGGGYYFVPPIPNKDISQIGEQFFD